MRLVECVSDTHTHTQAGLAQSEEHLTCNQDVLGSTPRTGPIDDVDGFTPYTDTESAVVSTATLESLLRAISVSLDDLTVSQAQTAIETAMERVGLSKSEIARRLDLHHSTVCDTLQPRHNLTVKTMARLLRVCGYGVQFELYELCSSTTKETE